jgi:alcohol dehydrogenase class IV
MWEMVNNRRILFGENKINEIPEVLNWYNLKKVLFVSDKSNEKLRGELAKNLKEKNIDVVIYDKISGEPDLNVINNGRDLFVETKCDCTIGFGGGSVIDTAKTIGMLAVNGGMIENYQMDGKQVTKLPPFFIAIPTTAGTGAEATKVAVVKNNANGLKKSLYHNTMIADIVVLDPTAIEGLPARITAATGMDALSHAIESYVSLNATPISEMYGLQAIRLIKKSLEKTYTTPHDLEARGDMLLASYFGGCAISAGIGIAHIMAQPLGAMYNIPHGDACSIFLPISMEFNLDFATEKYANVAQALGVFDYTLDSKANALRAIEEVKRIRASLEAPSTLKPYLEGKNTDLDFMVDTVQRTTGHVNCNPRPVNSEVFKEMFNLAK